MRIIWTSLPRIESNFYQGSRGEEFWLKEGIGELIWSLTQIMNRLMMVDECNMLLDNSCVTVSGGNKLIETPDDWVN